MEENNSEMNGCEKVRGCLDSYLSAELPVEITADVSKHLESCRDCSAALAEQAQLKQVLQRAVRQENASDALRERIRRVTRAAPPRAASPVTSVRWAFAALALLVACLGIWSALILRHGQQASDTTSYQANLARTVSEPTREMLNIGLSDHIECALENGFAKQHSTSAEMTRTLGANYARLLPLVQEKAGTDYEVVVAHHCIADGREFVHLILRNGETILSVVLTEKNGESFSGNDQIATLETSGMAVYQSRLQDFAVAGFETPKHLAFVVSNLRVEDNLRIAAQVAPSVRDFLARMEASASPRKI
jgi:hypothetical protein